MVLKKGGSKFATALEKTHKLTNLSQHTRAGFY